jgi:hypothetical protein
MLAYFQTLAEIMITIGIPLISYYLQQKASLEKDANARARDIAARDGLMAIADYAAHYGLQQPAAKGDLELDGRHGPISVDTGQVAVAVDYLLHAAKDEIAHLNLSDGEVVRLVRASIAKAQGVAFPLIKLTTQEKAA